MVSQCRPTHQQNSQLLTGTAYQYTSYYITMNLIYSHWPVVGTVWVVSFNLGLAGKTIPIYIPPILQAKGILKHSVVWRPLLEGKRSHGFVYDSCPLLFQDCKVIIWTKDENAGGNWTPKVSVIFQYSM